MASTVTHKTEIVTCPQFSTQENIKHGFFTKKGGVSKGIYESLNHGLGSNDAQENVHQNRKISMQSFGYQADNLCTLLQTHSNTVITLNKQIDNRPEGDALVTKTHGIVLGILTADCTPVLFADNQNKVIGAAHAGWKGASGGILENTVMAMQKLGAKPNNIHAVIGPTISQKSYEVGDEYYQRFIEFSPNNTQFFVQSKSDKHYMFDLPGFAKSRLETMGLASVTDIQRDTCAEATNFFSYRRSCLNKEGDYGRNLSVIALK